MRPSRRPTTRSAFRNDQAKFKSHVQRVETFNLFERYVLERHPDHEYASYLGTLMRIMDEDVLLSLGRVALPRSRSCRRRRSSSSRTR